MFENPRRGRQARNFTTNVPKILDLKSSSEQIFSRKLSLGAPDFGGFRSLARLQDFGKTGLSPPIHADGCVAYTRGLGGERDIGNISVALHEVEPVERRWTCCRPCVDEHSLEAEAGQVRVKSKYFHFNLYESSYIIKIVIIILYYTKKDLACLFYLQYE